MLGPHRRRGYASEILRLSLGLARGLDLPRVLLICDEDNLGSRRVIERHGGQFAGHGEPDGEKPRRLYWIELAVT